MVSRLGPGAPGGYLLWAVRQLARFHAFQLTVEEGANRETFDAVEVRIANGPFHGGIELVEDAELNSGRITRAGRRGTVASPPAAESGLLHLFGAHRRWGQVRQFAAASMRISSEPALPISIDGEVLASTPVVVGAKPGSLLVMAPLGAGPWKPRRGDNVNWSRSGAGFRRQGRLTVDRVLGVSPGRHVCGRRRRTRCVRTASSEPRRPAETAGSPSGIPVM